MEGLKKVLPAPNVIFAFIGGLLAAIAEHYAAKMGYEAPKDISDALPYAIAMFIAHAYDLWTGGNKNP